MTNPDGGRFSYVFDAAGRVGLLVNPQVDRTSYAYDAAGRRTLKKLSNGTRASLVYDAADRMTRLANLGPGGTTLSSFAYTYDNVSNRMHVAESNGDRVTWVYDALDQLIAERRSGANAYANTCTYDAARNRRSQNTNGSLSTYAYDVDLQVRYLLSPAGRTTYLFDANGNQTLVISPSGGRTTTTWDYENLPTTYKLAAGGRVTSVYNGDARRVAKTTGSGTTKFVWDGSNYLQETDGGDATTCDYTVEPHDFGSAVSQRRSGASSYLLFDGQKSTRQATDGTATSTDSWVYDAWGNIKVRSGSTSIFLEYRGQQQFYQDTETGLIRTAANTLDPVSGRFLAQRKPVSNPLNTYWPGQLFDMYKNKYRCKEKAKAHCVCIPNKVLRVDPDLLGSFSTRSVENGLYWLCSNWTDVSFPGYRRLPPGCQKHDMLRYTGALKGWREEVRTRSDSFLLHRRR